MADQRIVAVLNERIVTHRTRYHEEPDSLPVTLDEWVWYAATLSPLSRPVPTEFQGIPLRLVEAVYEPPGGGVAVRP